ncbi:MAG: hypothetical protein IPM52_12060 [Bacteroidetes bacterium]|nr:hypothetical protein [Bacteroidota bacterium]
MNIKLYFPVLFVSLSVWLLAACGRRPDRAQSEKLIRAADTELTGLTKRISETHGMLALRELMRLTETDAPLPIETGNLVSELAKKFPVSEENSPVKADTAQGMPLRMVFPYRFRDDSLAVFELQQLQTAPSLLMDDFPLAFSCRIVTASGTILLDVSHQASLKHELPESVASRIRTGAFEIRISLKTSFRKKNSHVRAELNITEAQTEKLEVRFRSMVNLTQDQQFQFGRKSLSVNVFPIRIDLKGERGFHTYDPMYFVRDFNQDNHIAIYDRSGYHLADIVLTETAEKDHINPVVLFENGERIELEALMKSIRNLLRMKLRHI